MSIVMGRTLGQQFCEALGLDASRVLDIQISMRPNEIATVDVKFGLQQDEVPRLIEVMRRYVLTDPIEMKEAKA